MKKLFTVPSGGTVSEKDMLRVMICTACSILICMGCIVGSAWAWFTVGLESADNAIVMGRFEPVITVSQLQSEADGSYKLVSGQTCTVQVKASDCEVGGYLCVQFADDKGNLSHKLISARLDVQAVPESGKTDVLNFTVKAQQDCVMTFSVGWGLPAGAVVNEGVTLVYENGQAAVEQTATETGE